jgi:hypothetical protein
MQINVLENMLSKVRGVSRLKQQPLVVQMLVVGEVCLSSDFAENGVQFVESGCENHEHM